MVADNQNLMLLDCGHSDSGFRPSQFLPSRWRAVQGLVVSHYDSDHVSDLAELFSKMPVERLRTNQSISLQEIRRLKEQEGAVTAGMEALLRMKNSFGAPGAASPPDLAGITVQTFSHTYGQQSRFAPFPLVGAVFEDMNNLSIVAFIEYHGFGIVFPGDLEKAGLDGPPKQSSVPPRPFTCEVKVSWRLITVAKTAIAKRSSNGANPT